MRMSSRSLQAFVIVALLCAIGLAIMIYKVTVLGFPLLKEQRAEIWTVEVQATVEGQGGSATVTVALPSPPDGFSLVDRDVVAPDFGERIEGGPQGEVAIFERRRFDGSATLFVLSRFFRVDSDAPRPGVEGGAERIDTARAQLAAAPAFDRDMVEELIARARSLSVDQVGLAREAATILATDNAMIAALDEAQVDGPDLSDPVRRLVFVLNVAGIDARRVAGLDLVADRRRAPVRAWVEVVADGERTVIDPFAGTVTQGRTLSAMEGAGDAPLIATEGAELTNRAYSIRQSFASGMDRALWLGERNAPPFAKLSPMILSIEAQLVFQVLLLLPIGALAIACIRQLIGIRTFGTFMPVLIALAFRDTQLALGIALFVAVVVLGLVLRSFFNILHLTLVPRLTAVLSIVTLIMLVIAVAGAAGDVRLGLSLSLFPIVILTMTIESMSLIWDEYGPREALTRAGGSLISAIAGYLVISIPAVQHLVFVFPEILLLVIGAAIALGRYNGFTLLEFVRFRMIEGPRAEAKGQS